MGTYSNTIQGCGGEQLVTILYSPSSVRIAKVASSARDCSKGMLNSSGFLLNSSLPAAISVSRCRAGVDVRLVMTDYLFNSHDVRFMSDEMDCDHLSTSARSAAVSIDTSSSSGFVRLLLSGSLSCSDSGSSLARVSSVCTLAIVRFGIAISTKCLTARFGRENIAFEWGNVRNQTTAEVILYVLSW